MPVLWARGKTQLLTGSSGKRDFSSTSGEPRAFLFLGACCPHAPRPCRRCGESSPRRSTSAATPRSSRRSSAASRRSTSARASVIEQWYPALEEHIEDILPKKSDLHVCKCTESRQVILDPSGEFIFFQCRSGPFIPTLRLLHRYPDILPKYQVDRGAIRFVLSGANIMSPGLTSTGGRMDDVPAESIIAVYAEGKEHALAIGVTTLSTETIRSENKGVAVENTHYLKDGLWLLRRHGEAAA